MATQHVSKPRDVKMLAAANPLWPYRTVAGFPIVLAKFTLLRNYTFFHNEF